MDRRAAILFPISVVLAANAPFLMLMASPPDAATLDEMKAEWCKGDYCTLLSGGSGFGGSEYGGDYVESPESAAEAASILKEAGIDQ